MTNWFEGEKIKFFKDEKKKFLKGKPKKDNFKPNKALKTAGGLVIATGGILAGIKMIEAMGNA